MPARKIGYMVGFIMLMTLPIRSQDLDSLMNMRDSSLISVEQIDLQLQIAYVISDTDIREALVRAKRALRDAEELESLRWTSEAKLAIGKFYDFMGVNEEAADHLMSAFTSFGQLGDSLKQANTLMHIGNTYFYLGQYEPALKYYSLVSEYGRGLHDTTIIISGINSTAAVYGNTGKMDSALILFKEAHALSKESGSLSQEILAYFNMGDVHLYSGRRTQALDVFHNLEDNYNMEINIPRIIPNLYNSTTKAYVEKNNLDMARQYSERTLEALEQNMSLTEYKEYFLNLYKIDTLEQDTEKALEHFIRFKELSDSLNSVGFKERLANLEIYFELQSKENQIERLTLDNQFKDLKIRQKRITNQSYIGLSILLLIIIFLVIRSSRRTREKNILLEKQKEDLKAAQQQLVQSEKMATIGTLTAGVAHEINNPLNFISGGLTIVKELQDELDWKGHKEEEERCKMATKMAFDGLDRSVGIVKAMMTFSHRGGSKKVASDLHEIIDNTLMFLKSKISDDIQIIKQYRLDCKAPLFPAQMHQVVMNMLSNAIYAVDMNAGGPKIIIISTAREDNNLLLTFSNSGPPIEVEHMKQLFDPFFTTKEPGEGTGLGLSICYTLVKEHGGEIEADSTSEGSRFTIKIPLDKPA